MRNKFVYSCSVKIHASGFDKLLESMVCPPAGCGSIFPAKSCQDASAGERSGGYVDEVELCRPICSTLEALVVWCVFACCCGEELGPFCWPMLAADVVFGASHRFAEHTSQMSWFCWDSESCSGSEWQQIMQQWPWPLFCWRFGFGKCLGASSQSYHWVGHCRLYKICFLLHVTIQLRNGLLLLHRIRRHFRTTIFLICGQPTRHPLIEPFYLSGLLQMPDNIAWLTLSSLATSLVVVRGQSSMILSVGHCQLLMAGHCAPHRQGSRLLCKTSWPTTALYVH